MNFFKKDQEVIYRPDFSKRKADIRELVLEKNSYDQFQKKIQTKIIIILFLFLVAGLAIALI